MCDVCVSVCISVFVYIYDSWSNTFIYATRVLDQTILCCRCFQSWIRFYKAGSIFDYRYDNKMLVGKHHTGTSSIKRGHRLLRESGVRSNHHTSLVPTSVDITSTLSFHQQTDIRIAETLSSFVSAKKRSLGGLLLPALSTLESAPYTSSNHTQKSRKSQQPSCPTNKLQKYSLLTNKTKL